jgi:TonB family protein
LLVAVIGLGTGAWFFAPRLVGASGGATAPTSQLGVEPPGESGLGARQIQAVVVRHSVPLRTRCWRPDTRVQHTSRIRVKLTIAPSGSVIRAVPENPSLRTKALEKCVVAEVETWKFPPAPRQTEATVPFVFNAQ